MKNKILYIILTILFIGVLIFFSVYMNKIGKNTTKIEDEKEGNIPSNVIEATDENFDELVKSNNVVLIDFYADWCVPCNNFSPILYEVASSNKNIKVVKVNIDKMKKVSELYDVKAIPTLVVIRNGKEVYRSLGYIKKEEVIKLAGLGNK